MAIFDAAAKGDLERVRAIVEQDGGLVHATDNFRCTPLLHAASNGHVEVARYLIDFGAAVNHRDHVGMTALLQACIFSHIKVTSLLLDRGADVTVTTVSGHTPLMFGGGAVARALLEHGGSDVDACDDDDQTACHYACWNEGEAGRLRQLLEAGADPTLQDAHGETAKETAYTHRDEECVAVLDEWDRAYLLQRSRRLRDASSLPSSNTPQEGS